MDTAKDKSLADFISAKMFVFCIFSITNPSVIPISMDLSLRTFAAAVVWNGHMSGL